MELQRIEAMAESQSWTRTIWQQPCNPNLDRFWSSLGHSDDRFGCAALFFTSSHAAASDNESQFSVSELEPFSCSALSNLRASSSLRLGDAKCQLDKVLCNLERSHCKVCLVAHWAFKHLSLQLSSWHSPSPCSDFAVPDLPLGRLPD